MARQVTCVCGRRFHIGHRVEAVQCRKCGRWWSGRELGTLGAVATLLLGGEVAGTRRRNGDRQRSDERPHRGKQTNRRRPARNPVGSLLRWMFS